MKNSSRIVIIQYLKCIDGYNFKYFFLEGKYAKNLSLNHKISNFTSLLFRLLFALHIII